MHHVALRLLAADPTAPVREELSAPPRPPPGAWAEDTPHLLWWFAAGDGWVEAHYLFDDAYAASHPEALDEGHLALLHALLNVKLFDDGDVLISPTQLRGALRWPAVDEPRPALRPR